MKDKSHYFYGPKRLGKIKGKQPDADLLQKHIDEMEKHAMWMNLHRRQMQIHMDSRR